MTFIIAIRLLGKNLASLIWLIFSPEANTAAIIGGGVGAAGVGVVVLLTVIIVIICVCTKGRKRNKKIKQLQYLFNHFPVHELKLT